MTQKYIRIEKVGFKGVTAIYDIIAVKKGEVIGNIEWGPSWRQYCFYPNENTMWSRSCLQDVIDFIQELMDERKRTKNE